MPRPANAAAAPSTASTSKPSVRPSAIRSGRDADRARRVRALPEPEVQHAGELHLGIAAGSFSSTSSPSTSR